MWPAAYPQGYAVVDVETTGLALDDRIVSAAVYRLDAQGNVEDHWYTLVNPERDPGPVWIHGLTSDVLEGAPLFPEIAAEFAARLDGRVLVAHNAMFDWQMIARETRARSPPRPTPAAVHDRARQGAVAAAAQPQAGVARRALRCRAAARAQRARRRAGARRGVPAEPARGGRAGNVRLPAPGVPAADRVGLDAHAAADRPAVLLPGGQLAPLAEAPAVPVPQPRASESDKPLKQGMRVAFSGDTSVDRELLEDRTVEAGLHVAGSVSRLTSLLVTNDPDSAACKTLKARSFGTPVVREAAYTQLLRDVSPADG
ncbi:DEDDh family exonuclease [Streptomyces tanashiensis]